MPICLSFAGVAGCIAFEVGAAKELLALVAAEGQEVTAYAGLSSGSVVATLLALDYTPEEIDKHFERFTTFFSRWHHHPVTHWFSHLRKLWYEIMPEDAYKRLSGRLYIGYSAVGWRGLQPRVVSRYYCNEDVMHAIEASCHIMPYRFIPAGRFRGDWACDGAFSTRLLRPEGYQVVGITAPMVHNHVFWSDWSPTLCLYKKDRLASAGEAFVQRHHSYFRELIRGNTPTPLALPSYFNPFRWLRRLFWLCVLVLLWLRCRRLSRTLAKWALH
jgi:hypothetical protein